MTEHQGPPNNQPDDGPTGAHAPGGPDTRAETGRGSSWWPVLAPAAALLVGLVLGGVLVGVVDGDDDPSAEPQPSSSPTTGDVGASPSATIVVVPDECLAAADSVEEALRLVERGAGAIRDFQSEELRELLRELEDLDTRARAQAEACLEVRTEQSPSE